jgi:aminopeptidase YwaD
MILGYLEKITAFGSHVTKTSSSEELGDYIYNEFQNMGLDVRYQSWEMRVPYLKRPFIYHGWYNGKNIEATLPGTDENCDKIFVIFAHYDGWKRSPAADDDGSGVAAVLSAAEIMSEYEFNHSVRFVTVSGHEQGLLGSYSYVKEAAENNDNIVAALCVDMIGYTGTNDEDNKVRVFENEQSSWITNFTINISKVYSELFDLEVITVDDPKGHASDYLNFWDFGINTVFYHEIVMTDYRHTPKDTIENMDVPYATKITQLITATLAEFAWSNLSKWPEPTPASMPTYQLLGMDNQENLTKFPILEQIFSSHSYFNRILQFR